MMKALSILLSVLIATPAIAQELPLESHFHGIESCYGRTYSAAHLDKHPDQQVIDIGISHFPTKQQLLGMDSPNQPYPDTPKFVAKLALFKRGQDIRWEADAFCEPDGKRIKCNLECDAGNFYLTEHKSGGLLLTGGSDLSFDSCDAGDRTLMREPDDTSFLLQSVPRSICVPPK
ncbi:hypothetical protein [Lentilitoribacter sp. EG35]|uniref:hypothetical protein n=1 Tax=Lentilitoribacter sp. EG35 TaxID=3234192 RepID=UPI00345FF222